MPLWTILVKWPAPVGPTCPQPVSGEGGEGFEDGLEAFDGGVVAADHEAVALLEAPDTAGGADVDELIALGGGCGVAALRVFVVGVATVDEGVAGLHEGFEGGDGLVDGIAGRDHDPDGARRAEVADHLLEGRDPERAGCGETRDGVVVEVEADDLVAREAKTLRHVEAHLAKSDDAQFHVIPFKSVCRRVWIR